MQLNIAKVAIMVLSVSADCSRGDATAVEDFDPENHAALQQENELQFKAMPYRIAVAYRSLCKALGFVDICCCAVERAPVNVPAQEVFAAYNCQVIARDATVNGSADRWQQLEPFHQVKKEVT